MTEFEALNDSFVSGSRHAGLGIQDVRRAACNLAIAIILDMKIKSEKDEASQYARTLEVPGLGPNGCSTALRSGQKSCAIAHLTLHSALRAWIECLA